MTIMATMAGNREHYVPRLLDLPRALRSKSHFLFGPRQTGKSTLIRRQLDDALVYNLLDTKTYLDLSSNPGRLQQEVGEKRRVVVIDEIQRLPELLNEVHLLIEERRTRFLLTGSSARKLRRGGVNLLGGRARTLRLYPFTAGELGDHFKLDRALHRGLLPSVYFSDDPDADLEAYAGSYLREEVVAEGSVRNVPAFSRFLKVAALCNGSIVNFTNIAGDAQVPRTTVYEYFDILRDTLLLHELPAWKMSARRKPIRSSKYYFFDIGVVRSLQGRSLAPGTREHGEAFESWIMHELVCHRDYASGGALSFWRSTSGFEVDFIVGDHTAVEVKAKQNISPRDLKSLRALSEEGVLKRFLCVSLEPRVRRIGKITILPWRVFLETLWSGEYDG
jgi:predicted AAA+ superfamily ATPase